MLDTKTISPVNALVRVITYLLSKKKASAITSWRETLLSVSEVILSVAGVFSLAMPRILGVKKFEAETDSLAGDSANQTSSAQMP